MPSNLPRSKELYRARILHALPIWKIIYNPKMLCCRLLIKQDLNAQDSKSHSRRRGWWLFGWDQWGWESLAGGRPGLVNKRYLERWGGELGKEAHRLTPDPHRLKTVCCVLSLGWRMLFEVSLSRRALRRERFPKSFSGLWLTVVLTTF